MCDVITFTFVDDLCCRPDFWFCRYCRRQQHSFQGRRTGSTCFSMMSSVGPKVASSCRNSGTALSSISRQATIPLLVQLPCIGWSQDTGDETAQSLLRQAICYMSSRAAHSAIHLHCICKSTLGIQAWFHEGPQHAGGCHACIRVCTLAMQQVVKHKENMQLGLVFRESMIRKRI